MKKLILILLLSIILTFVLTIAVQASPITAYDYTGYYGRAYNFVWDGWQGTLVLYPWAPGSYLQTSGGNRNVRYQILLNPQDYVDGMYGAGYVGVPSYSNHRVILWVDFNNTPSNPNDDQKFEGYMMTATKNAFAGVTWWGGIPFGFYATYKMDVPG
jgi:hypothetical protein